MKVLCGLVDMIVWMGVYDGQLLCRHLGCNDYASTALVPINPHQIEQSMLVHVEVTHHDDSMTPTIGQGVARYVMMCP